MSDIVTVYAVFADVKEAERIARAMVERRLAACANILGPCRSIYRWRGAIETAEEAPALFKARADHAEALITAIAKLHSYDVPAIVAWPMRMPGPPMPNGSRRKADDRAAERPRRPARGVLGRSRHRLDAQRLLRGA